MNMLLYWVPDKSKDLIRVLIGIFDDVESIKNAKKEWAISYSDTRFDVSDSSFYVVEAKINEPFDIITIQFTKDILNITK